MSTNQINFNSELNVANNFAKLKAAQADTGLGKRLNNLNFEILIQILAMGFFLGLDVYGIVSQRYQAFIHPRYLSILVITAVILTGAILAQATRLFEYRRHHRYQLYLWLLLPALIIFLLKPMSGNKVALETYQETGINRRNQAFNLLLQNDMSGSGTAKAETKILDMAGTDAPSLSQAEQVPSVEGATTVAANQYADWLIDVMMNTDAHLGKRYTFLARITDQDGLPPQTFLPGRAIMFCCAADAKPLGLVAQIDGQIQGEKLKSLQSLSRSLGQWVYVVGRVDKMVGVNMSDPKKLGPCLVVENLQEAEQPGNNYVYYYGNIGFAPDPKLGGPQ